MKKQSYTRRKFIRDNTLAGIGATVGMSLPAGDLFSATTVTDDTPALLGGRPLLNHDWPNWPIWKPEEDEKLLLEVMRSGVWSRNKVVDEFEKQWAEIVGAKRCLTVVNGTNALNTALAQLEVGWGDEVLVTPYTFIASISCILYNGAIPVFVDIDSETFQMDPQKIEEKITPQTKAILPVHILGLPCDMKSIMAIAEKHDLLVIEDACQSWLAEIDGKQTGTFGHAGCYSFQNSKNMAMGEGGAIVSDDDEFMDRCYSYHNYGNAYGSVPGELGSGAVMIGTKLRLTEYQAAIGLAQLSRLQEQTTKRNENAEYLSSLIREIPGIIPYRLYDGVTRAAYHLYPFRYDQEGFKGLSRGKFLEALRAEGVPCSKGYAELNKMPVIKNAFQSKFFRQFYPSERVDYQVWMEENQCPNNEKMCNEEAVWLFQNMLLGSRSDMDMIAGAISKIQRNAEKLK